MSSKWIAAALLLLFTQTARAQTQTPAVRPADEYQSWNPARNPFPVLEGQAWPNEVKNAYDRLPARAEHEVRKEVWDLSENPAGLRLRFKTNAPEIRIAYQATGALQYPHMPATGVSGVDMYARETNGKWLWCGGKFSFGDTISYRFPDLTPGNGQDSTREYTLYLPLYNAIKWITISVNRTSIFEPLPARNDKPIVVYGTSIAQGGCATRPGMAWPAILQRKQDLPLVNLGFSGNGRLEKEVLELLAEVDARLYVLDCLPNMISPAFPPNEVKKRLVAAIQLLQSKRPGIPILLSAHAGYTDEGTNDVRRRQYQDANEALQQTFDSLTAAGTTNIYLLSKQEIGLDIDSMVDGTHPNDMGMMRYAQAYDKKIRTILRGAKR
jgi:lysophospholipase L1-like esterase